MLITVLFVVLGTALYIVCGLVTAHVLAKYAQWNWSLESNESINLLLVPLLCMLWPFAALMVYFYSTWMRAGNKYAAQRALEAIRQEREREKANNAN